MLFRKTGRLISLSEQQILDCTENARYGQQGCGGGTASVALTYIRDQGGIDSNASYPYIAFTGGDCFYQPDKAVGEDKGYVALPAGDEHAMKAAVATVGPLSVALNSDCFAFQIYDRGVIDTTAEECSPENLDHAVLVVGYGSDGATGLDYWIVKNSWGTDWGEAGYARIARGSNVLGIANLVVYPLV